MTDWNWRLDDGRQTMVLCVRHGGMAEVIYWGASLPQAENLEELVRCHQMDVTGGMLDANPPLSICPLQGETFPGQPGVRLRKEDGSFCLARFEYGDAEQGKDRLSLHFCDQENGLRYVAHFVVHRDSQLISMWAELEADEPVYVSWLAAPVVPASQNSDVMIDFSGRWCGEFKTNEIAWMPGCHVRDNPTGRTGHEHFPGLIIPNRGAANIGGDIYAFHYGWSGGHRMVAEELPDGRRQVQFGHASDSELKASCHFQTAPLYVTYSPDGMNGCAVSFQRHVRDQLVQWTPKSLPRPVHYNCWEAIYFDHKIDELIEIASKAAALGAERFVLDDGWFGRRDDDTNSLGDWVLDERKYPDGLAPLIDAVHDLGMSFGIWFEPEMVNQDSDLYRAHPDWILGGADQVQGRQQLVLNMALPGVQDYLDTALSAIFATNAIDYVKWDHNRVLPISDASQVRGTYALLDRLRSKFPNIEFESCASGGGRIDFGILEKTQRVWLSDSNDALERLRIQHDAALFLPACVTGSHVGPAECHTSGRKLDISLRAWVAAQRHMGFEMDPRELSDQDAETLIKVTNWWKHNRDWLFDADILRLESSEPAIIAEQQLAAEKSRFVVFAGKIATSNQILPRPLCLTGLEPEARYRVELVNRYDVIGLSRGMTALKEGAITVSGAYLMQHGLTLPWSFPDQIWVIEGHRL